MPHGGSAWIGFRRVGAIRTRASRSPGRACVMGARRSLQGTLGLDYLAHARLHSIQSRRRRAILLVAAKSLVAAGATLEHVGRRLGVGGAVFLELRGDN